MPLPGHFLKANGACWARNSLKSWLEQFRAVLGNNKMISVKGEWPSWTLGNDALCFPAGSWHSIFKRHIENWTLKAESKWVIVLEMCLTQVFLKAKAKRLLSFWFVTLLCYQRQEEKGTIKNEKGVMGCFGDRVKSVSVNCGTRREMRERTESWIQRSFPLSYACRQQLDEKSP